MSTPTEGFSMNGHTSPEPDTLAGRRRADSDLSDAQHSDASDHGRDGHHNGVAADHNDDVDMDEESDVTTPDNASDDGDYDVRESPAPSHHDHDDDDLVVVDEDDRASSTDSTRAPKRKAAAVEEDFMRANPELYGLRRSVCAI